ncbi:ankyrin repeat and SOCS box protein 1-like [Centruroides vittatus]|uniref:ankyrin repeat and SOCS box protein 1-like n=1 Tax=Centruroides vittatus TaxID=120091 RepID=UPI00350FE615
MLNIRHFIVDPDDGDTRLHYAAFDGDLDKLTELLSEPERKQCINRRVRPFGATPIRLAATSGSYSCIEYLIENGADVEIVDVKGQTPLFVAVQKNFVDCARLLLENGADPNGSGRNRSSPLFIAAKDGYVDCVKLLLKYGADTELIDKSLEIPGFPLYIAAIYQHYECYTALLLAGAETDLRRVVPSLLPSKYAQISLSHALVRHCCPAIYAKLFVEFGGYLWQKDLEGLLVTELNKDNSCKAYFQEIISMPLRLQSICRIAIRRWMGRAKLDKILKLPLPLYLLDYLLYTDLIK